MSAETHHPAPVVGDLAWSKDSPDLDPRVVIATHPASDLLAFHGIDGDAVTIDLAGRPLTVAADRYTYSAPGGRA
jgi:hypothetical protein